MPFDGTDFQVETKPEHDLSTPRGRLLYLRDVVVPGIPPEHLRMEIIRCGTAACLGGWASQDPCLANLGIGRNRGGADLQGFLTPGWDDFFGLSNEQGEHLFIIDSYNGCTDHEGYIIRQPTHAELTQHINDVLEGRVK